MLWCCNSKANGDSPDHRRFCVPQMTAQPWVSDCDMTWHSYTSWYGWAVCILYGPRIHLVFYMCKDGKWLSGSIHDFVINCLFWWMLFWWCGSPSVIQVRNARLQLFCQFNWNSRSYCGFPCWLLHHEKVIYYRKWQWTHDHSLSLFLTQEDWNIRTWNKLIFYIHVTVLSNRFIFNNQPDTLINQIYSVKKLYMFQASSLPIISSSVPYIRHW